MTTARVSDTRPFCLACGVRMRCVQNGYRQQISWGWVQYGDVFACEMCGLRVVVGWGDAHYEGAAS